MNSIILNSQKKAERIIHAGHRTHNMTWQKYYSTNKDGFVITQYIIFYRQREVKVA